MLRKLYVTYVTDKFERSFKKYNKVLENLDKVREEDYYFIFKLHTLVNEHKLKLDRAKYRDYKRLSHVYNTVVHDVISLIDVRLKEIKER